MANETKVLPAEVRSLKGTGNSRRLRAAGKVPAALYGLGEEPQSLTLAAEHVTPIVVSGSQIIDLDLDGTTSKAMIREVQWDTFLTHILHVDLQRLDPNARVDLELTIDTRGTVNEGVLDQVVRTIEVNCPVYLVPENPEVRVGALKIGDTVTIADLGFSSELNVSLPADTVVIRVSEAQDVEIVEEDVNAAVEPELIGRKADDEDGDE